jgi:hypothetical protein
MALVSVGYVVTCSIAASPCPIEAQTTQAVVLIDPAYQVMVNLLLETGGMDWSTVSWVFSGGLLTSERPLLN